MSKGIMFADGGSRGNPGPAASGAVVFNEKGEEIARVGRFLGVATNNVAEYTSIIIGMQLAKENDIKELEVYLDSELAVKQLNGIYRVKAPHIKPLHQDVKKLCTEFVKVDFAHVRREKNKVADSIVNEVLDQQT